MKSAYEFWGMPNTRLLLKKLTLFLSKFGVDYWRSCWRFTWYRNQRRRENRVIQRVQLNNGSLAI